MGGSVGDAADGERERESEKKKKEGGSRGGIPYAFTPTSFFLLPYSGSAFSHCRTPTPASSLHLFDFSFNSLQSTLSLIAFYNRERGGVDLSSCLLKALLLSTFKLEALLRLDWM